MADSVGGAAGTGAPKTSEVEEQIAASFLAGLIGQISTIKILVGAQLTTVEAAIAQIRQTQRDLPERFRAPSVSREVESAISLLRDHDFLPSRK